MPTSTKFSNPQPTIALRERSSSSRQNSVEADAYNSLNTLDDDVNRIETALGIAADAAEASINYSSNRAVTDGTDPITAIGALDAAITLDSEAVHRSTTTNASGTIAVTSGSANITGTGTGFVAGDVGKYIRTAGGQIRKIATVTNATTAAAETNFTTTESGVNFIFLEEVNSAKNIKSPIVVPSLILPGSAGFTPELNGHLGYDTTAHALEVMINSTARTLYHDGNLTVGYPKGYISGPPVRYSTAAAVIIPTGLKVRNSTNSADIEVTADLTVSLAAAGANGLDSGAEAANTWYYLYLIKKSSDGTVAGLWSTVNESSAGAVTLPADYDLKRQLPFAARNNGSSNIIQFTVAYGWPHRPFITYDTIFDDNTFTPRTSTTQILAAGAATAWAAVSTATYVPPISKYARFLMVSQDASARLNEFRPTGTTTYIILLTTARVSTPYFFDMATNASQSIDYQVSGGSIDLNVFGFVVTEVN